MSQPAARLTDLHTCPMVTVLVPHVGGPVIGPGVPNVLIGNLPAATMTNMCTCVGPPDMIMQGAFTVLIGGMPAARMGDMTLHGGIVTFGAMNVLIGGAGLSLSGVFDAAMGAVNDLLAKAKAAFVAGLVDLANKLKTEAEKLMNAIIEKAQQMVKDAVNAIEAKIQSVIKVIEVAIKAIENKAEDTVKAVEDAVKAVENAINDILGTGSTSNDGNSMGSEETPSQKSFEDKMTDARLRADSLPEAQKQQLYDKINKAERLNQAQKMARLSGHVYDGKGGLPKGITEVSPEELQNMGIDPGMIQDDRSGFKSKIYKDENGKYIIAYAGTETGTIDDVIKDGGTDIKQGLGYKTEQYDRAMILATTMRNNVGPDGFETTGHSLGRGLSAAANAVTGSKGTGFNGAALHANTTRGKDGVSDAERTKNGQNMEDYYSTADPLNASQDNRGKVIGGIGVVAAGIGGAIAGPSGAGVGAGWAAEEYSKGSLPAISPENRHPITPPPGKDSYSKGHQMENLEEGMAIQQQKQLDSIKNLLDK